MVRITEIFAANLQRLRSESGLTQAALAEKIGAEPIIVQNYERQRRWPRPEQITKLAGALGVEEPLLFESRQSESVPRSKYDRELREARHEQEILGLKLRHAEERLAELGELGPVLGGVASILAPLNEDQRNTILTRVGRLAVSLRQGKLKPHQESEDCG